MSMRSRRLPARLIEISHDPGHEDRLRAKLVTPVFQAGLLYVCLSHRWGDLAFLQLRRDNMIRFFQEIPWTELPQTFQEAMWVTFRLNLRFIWVDSLCICQDDTEDWRREGSRMDTIYSDAHLTLAASVSGSANQGLFVNSPLKTSRVLQWQHRFQAYDIHARAPFRHEQLDALGMPLLERAWVFQERLLSTRIAHFTSTELLWECFEESTCECSALPEFVTDSRRKDKQVLEDDMFAKATWHDLVQEYSTKQLTYAKDIFPALQGLVRRIHCSRDDEYYAGLWRNTIHQDLLWCTIDYTRTGRPKQWRAPSWSWASVVGGVSWPALRRQEWHADTLIKWIDTVPIGEDEFGELGGGSLLLSGYCAQASLLHHTHVDTQGVSSHVFSLSLGDDHEREARSLVCQLDCNITLPEHQPLKPTDVLTSQKSSARLGCSAACRHENSSAPVPSYENVLVMRITRDIYLAFKYVWGSRKDFKRFAIAFADARDGHARYFDAHVRDVLVV